MFCPQCGAQVSDSANHCPQCGHTLSSVASSGTTPPPPANFQDYLTANIILLVVSVCCCGSLPSIVTGIIGVVFSSQARDHWRAGRWTEATAKARTARTMAIVSGVLLAVTAVILSIVLFAYGAIIFASMESMMSTYY